MELWWMCCGWCWQALRTYLPNVFESHPWIEQSLIWLCHKLEFLPMRFKARCDLRPVEKQPIDSPRQPRPTCVRTNVHPTTTHAARQRSTIMPEQQAHFCRHLFFGENRLGEGKREWFVSATPHLSKHVPSGLCTQVAGPARKGIWLLEKVREKSSPRQTRAHCWRRDQDKGNGRGRMLAALTLVGCLVPQFQQSHGT
jgi:hypothetical protein